MSAWTDFGTANYYAVLGVSPDASYAAVKAAYRQRARKLHPDVNPGDPEIKEKFTALVAAYEVIKDPDSRRLYDLYRSHESEPLTKEWLYKYQAYLHDRFDELFAEVENGTREIDPELQDVDVTLREVMLALDNLERQYTIGRSRRR